ncbi:MAG: hypothetical protein RBT19_04610 [Tenuifilaceae bacterium]|jgi:hypothetical protein|nr:hypothetical protein [Tenuifilaceae bacterium]
MMKAIEKNSPYIVWITSLVLLAVFSVLAFASLTPQQVSVYFNSDTFYLASIFRDTFVDGSGLQGWNLNAAPNFFPDFFIFSLINSLVSNVRLAYLVFSLVQVVLIALLFNAILLQVDKMITFHHLAISNLFLILFPLSTLISGDFIFTFYLFSLSYHTGAFVMALLALLLSLKILNRYSTPLTIALGLVVLVGTYNDKLFIPTFVFPLLLWLAFAFSRAKVRVLFLTVVTVLVSSVLGLVLFDVVRNMGYVHFIDTGWKMFNFSNVSSSFQLAGEQTMRYITKGHVSGWVVIISILVFGYLTAKVFGLASSMVKARREKTTYDFSTAQAFTLFAWANIPIVWLTPILNGSYVSPAILRFNIHAYYMAVLCVGYIVFLLISNKKYIAILSYSLVVGTTVLGFALWILNAESYSLKTVASFYPKRVEAIDDFVRETGVKYGISEYWSAKSSTMLSKEGARIYHVHPNLRIWYHVTNKNWYYKGGKGEHGNPRFEMIVMNGFDSTRVTNILGSPLLVKKYPEANLEIWKVREFEFDPQTQLPSPVE